MQNTVNHHATPKAKELLNYLSNIAGKKIITGQHTQTNPMDKIRILGIKTLIISPDGRKPMKCKCNDSIIFFCPFQGSI